MRQPVRHVSRFFSGIDGRTALSIFLSAALLVFVTLMLVYGQHWLNLEGEGRLDRLIAAAADAPWAVAAVVAIFAVLALTGFPQFLMIAATVAAFGPVSGALYAWVATMVSAGLTFAMGRVMGGAFVERRGGPRSRALIGFLGRRGILASALIRVVPSAPFIVVNAAAGAAQIALWKYAIGTGLGIIPKIVFVAAIAGLAPPGTANGGGANEPSEPVTGHVDTAGPAGIVDMVTDGGAGRFAMIAGALVIWLVMALCARAFYLQLQTRTVPPPAASEPVGTENPAASANPAGAPDLVGAPDPVATPDRGEERP